MRSLARHCVVVTCGFALLLIADIAHTAMRAQPEREVELLSHHLSVELNPNAHTLSATDRIALRVLTAKLSRLSFSLNANLQVTSIHAESHENLIPVVFTTESSPPRRNEPAIQQVTLRFEPPLVHGENVTLQWDYGGTIFDPPREPRHLRFVTPSETAGHIGPEGVYLSGETHWYPDLEGSLLSHRIRVRAPLDWLAVTHGKQVSEITKSGSVTSDWNITAKTEALTLVANRFVRGQRLWNGIEILTYLLPEHATLAAEYLNAAVRYLEIYTNLLGPYPFPKFAVVENFFASGLGMPSFMLLGSGVVKRHYVQPYALGHEIVHSWIGNWVFNAPRVGNWVEGLTTYLANYYYEELMGQPDQDLLQRRMMLLGYAVYVRPDEDYPVAEFRYKRDQRDNAVGYQKAAMIFHMLRREIGDNLFWRGIQALVADYGEKYADWHDLERVFADVSSTDLRWFFAQWVERAGAPSLKLVDARSVQVDEGKSPSFLVTGRLVQTGMPYRLRLPARVQMIDGSVSDAVLTIQASDHTFVLPVRAKPIQLQIDAGFETFRRLDRKRLPPMLNLFVTDSHRFVVLPDGLAQEGGPYQEVGSRLSSQQEGQAVVVRSEHEFLNADGRFPFDGSVLVLGFNRAADWAVAGCGRQLRLEKDRFTVAGQTYEGPKAALLVSCRRTDRPEHVTTLFYGLTSSAAAKVSRLLFFYGWQSYVVFQDGDVVARGDFSSEESDLRVRFHDL